VGDGTVEEQQERFSDSNAMSPDLQVVKLSSMALSSIPADLPSSLIDIDLSFNGITHIETACLSGLTRLTSLSLYSNRLSQLYTLPALPSLAHISLGGAASKRLLLWTLITHAPSRVNISL
jgi:Leucine-rich repeat (LRR) protein